MTIVSSEALKQVLLLIKEKNNIIERDELYTMKISKETGFSRFTVLTILKILEDAGYIKRIRKGKKKIIIFDFYDREKTKKENDLSESKRYTKNREAYG